MVTGGYGKEEGIFHKTLRYPLGSCHTPAHRSQGTFVVPHIPLPPQVGRGVHLEQELLLNRLGRNKRNGCQLQDCSQRVGKLPELIPDNGPIPLRHEWMEEDTSHFFFTL